MKAVGHQMMVAPLTSTKFERKIKFYCEKFHNFIEKFIGSKIKYEFEINIFIKSKF